MHLGCRVTEKLIRALSWKYIDRQLLIQAATQQKSSLKNTLLAVNLFLAKYCKQYRIIEREPKTDTADSGLLDANNSMSGDEVEQFWKAKDEIIAFFSDGADAPWIANLKAFVPHWVFLLGWSHKKTRPTDGEKTQIEEHQKQFGLLFLELFNPKDVTPYVHITACHLLYYLSFLPMYVKL